MAVASYIAAHLTSARLIGRQALTGLVLTHGHDTRFSWIAGSFADGAVAGGVPSVAGRWAKSARRHLRPTG